MATKREGRFTIILSVDIARQKKTLSISLRTILRCATANPSPRTTGHKKTQEGKASQGKSPTRRAVFPLNEFFIDEENDHAER